MSFYTSLNGMKNAQSSLSTIAHNIANSETYGYKRGRASFSEIVAGSALATGATNGVLFLLLLRLLGAASQRR